MAIPWFRRRRNSEGFCARSQRWSGRTHLPESGSNSGKYRGNGRQFVEHFGSPSNEQVLVLPLALKDKVAALVYADGGDSGQLDSDALELLVLATSAWLEVISLRQTARGT